MCNTNQYLDYLACKCKKKIIDLILEECTEYDNKRKLVLITVTRTDNQTEIVNKTVENSCKVYIILTIVAIVISTVYTIYFVYYNWFLFKNKYIFTKYNTHQGSIKEITIKEDTYYFYNDIIDIETFDSKNLKLGKKRTKILIFTILDTLQLKKFVIVMMLIL